MSHALGRERQLSIDSQQDQDRRRGHTKESVPEEPIDQRPDVSGDHQRLLAEIQARSGPLVPIRRVKPRRVGRLDRCPELENAGVIQDLSGWMYRCSRSWWIT